MEITPNLSDANIVKSWTLEAPIAKLHIVQSKMLSQAQEKTRDFMQMCEKSGAEAITVHMRLRDERPAEPAHWDEIVRLWDAVKAGPGGWGLGWADVLPRSAWVGPRCLCWPMATSLADVKSMNSGSIAKRNAVDLRGWWSQEAFHGLPVVKKLAMDLWHVWNLLCAAYRCVILNNLYQDVEPTERICKGPKPTSFQLLESLRAS